MKKYIFGTMLLALVACKDEKQSTAAAPQVIQASIVVPQSTALEKFSWPSVKQDAISDNLLTENYYIVFDGSGSMDDKCNSSEKKIDIGKKAIAQFVKNINKDANVGMMVFDKYGTNERVSLSNDRTKLFKEIENIRAGGGTPLGESTGLAYTALEKQAVKQLGYGDYIIVYITDGDATDPSVLRKNINIITDKTPINIYTLGFCISNDHVLNQTGKTTYYVANNYEQLETGLNKIIAESSAFKKD